jgi:hypothetical protein
LFGRRCFAALNSCGGRAARLREHQPVDAPSRPKQLTAGPARADHRHGGFVASRLSAPRTAGHAASPVCASRSSGSKLPRLTRACFDLGQSHHTELPGSVAQRTNRSAQRAPAKCRHHEGPR